MRATSRACALAVAGILALGLPGATGSSAAATETLDSNPWAPWLGCWELVIDSDAADGQAPEGSRRVCMAAGPEPLSVEMTTWVDDDQVMTQEIRADGRARNVDQDGCVGTETARFSADGERLLVAAEHTCDGIDVRTSGITLLTSSDRWSDIQVSEVDDQREVLVRRYRRADSDRARDTGLATLAVRAARQASAAPLDAEDVVEAVELVDPAAVEAMLLERNDPFPMSADLLVWLADSEVPGNVIDLMVALSYPDYFVVDDGSPQPEPEDENYRDGYGRTRWMGSWAYPWYAYGYYDPFFAPFGYGYYYRPVRPVLISGSRFGGKVVKGRGYTRVQPNGNMPRGGLGRLFGGSGNRVGGDRGSGAGRSGGTVTPGGHTRSGGSSTGRTAKRRGGSGSDGGS